LFEDLYSNLLEKIRIDYEIIKADSAAALVQHVSNFCPQLKAVLIVQRDLSQKMFKKVQVKLSQYVKAGGGDHHVLPIPQFCLNTKFRCLDTEHGFRVGMGRLPSCRLCSQSGL